VHGFEKGPPPPALRDFIRAKTVDEGRTLANVAWDELDAATKQAIQETLAVRQGYLCAYCGSRIRALPDKMRIEHWEPQHAAPEKRFDWDNLLGVCLGDGAGRGSHCDRRRGELPPDRQRLHVKPDRDRAHLDARFAYRPTRGGLRVEGSDPAAHRDVDETLALNHPLLMANRAAAVERVGRTVLQRFQSRTLTHRFLDRLSAPDADNTLPPFLPALRGKLAEWRRKAAP
jgi:uncharacterized protein (TIGR02646 family)